MEGFNEIESLSTKTPRRRKLSTAQKTIRFIKRAATLAAKTLKRKADGIFSAQPAKKSAGSASVLDKRYIENRKNTNGEFSCSAKDAVSGFSLRSTRAYAHSAPSGAQRTHKLIKKRAVLAVVACMSAIILSCMTVASALENPDNAAEAVNSPAAAAAPQSEESTLPANGVDFGAATSDEALETINENAYMLIENDYKTAGLYVDGELLGVTDEADALENALNQILADYRRDYDDETTTVFANDVNVKRGNYKQDSYLTADELVAMADGKLSIELSTDIIYTRETAYETKVEYDESEYSSYEKVKTEGKNGEEIVTVRTTFVDGVQTDAVETGTKTIKKATDEVIIKGSKDGEAPLSSDESYSNGSSGTFCWPLPYTHSITSLFEWRWGRMHNGIDIADSGVYGQPIIAAASGTVTFSGGDGSGYGYHVIIDHGNGYETLYGHCCELAVSSGQHVSQGDVIGYVGSTGNSTGPHLHFEIRAGGDPQNPLGFVS